MDEREGRDVREGRDLRDGRSEKMPIRFKSTRCLVHGCIEISIINGVCGAHAGSVCTADGCNQIPVAVSQGLCAKHGGGQRCSRLDCSWLALKDGLCALHGKRMCRVINCTRVAQARGVCCRHGGRSKCKIESCSHLALSCGLCGKHGGGRRCTFDACTTRPVSNGLCAKHGGGKRCCYLQCENIARKGKLMCRLHLLNEQDNSAVHRRCGISLSTTNEHSVANTWNFDLEQRTPNFFGLECILMAAADLQVL